MRDSVKKVICEDIATLSEVTTILGADQLLIYRYVVTDSICEHLRIGRSHVVIDREDIPLIAERVARSNNFKTNRKAANTSA